MKTKTYDEKRKTKKKEKHKKRRMENGKWKKIHENKKIKTIQKMVISLISEKTIKKKKSVHKIKNHFLKWFDHQKLNRSTP